MALVYTCLADFKREKAQIPCRNNNDNHYYYYTKQTNLTEIRWISFYKMVKQLQNDGKIRRKNLDRAAFSITVAAGEQVAVISKEIFHMTVTYVFDIVNR